MRSFKFTVIAAMVVAMLSWASVGSVANAAVIARHFGDADPTTEATPWTKTDGVGDGTANADTFDGEAVWQVTDGAGTVSWGPNYKITLAAADFNAPWKLTARWGGDAINDGGNIIFADSNYWVQLIFQPDGDNRKLLDRNTSWVLENDLDAVNHLQTVEVWSDPSDTEYHFQVNGGTVLDRAKSLFASTGDAYLMFGGNGGGGAGLDTGYYREITLVPEPSSLALLGLGALSLLLLRRRQG